MSVGRLVGRLHGEAPNQRRFIMNEFAYFFRGNPANYPGQFQQQMQKWAAWMKELGAKTQVKERGRPVESTGAVLLAQNKKENFAGSDDAISGYMLIEAPDLTQATKLAEGCPIFDIGGTVEIRPVMKF
jgi:hypothetical protein